MDNRLTPQDENASIEETLKNIPLAPMPHSITPNVMAQIKKDVRPVFITWNDVVLSFVIAISVGALFFTIQNLPPILVAKFQIQQTLLYQDFLVNTRGLIPLLLFGFAMLLSILIIPLTTERQ